MKHRHGCGDLDIDLMMGETDSTGLAIRQSPRRGIVLLDECDTAIMDESTLRFLLAHEVGHHVGWNIIDSLTQSEKNGKPMPKPLSCLLARITEEIYADTWAVAECRSVETAADFLADGDPGLKSLFFNYHEPVPEKFYPEFETTIRLQALGKLAVSEYWQELQEAGSGAHNGVAATEHWRVIVDNLLSHYMDFSDSDALVLGQVLAAGLYIAGLRSGADKGWHEELEELAAYGEPRELLRFNTVEDAYDTIERLSPCIKGIRHPLKHIAYSVVAGAVYRGEDDADVAEEFMIYMADRAGVTKSVCVA